MKGKIYKGKTQRKHCLKGVTFSTTRKTYYSLQTGPLTIILFDIQFVA